MNKNSNGSSNRCKIIKEDTLNIYARSILFTTKDLLGAQLLSLRELVEKLPNISLPSEEYEYLILNDMMYLIIGNYKDHNIIIEYFKGDNLVYYIGCVKKKLFYLDKGVNVFPEWEEPENGKNCYKKRKFELYNGYLLKIDTEEMLNGITKTYTQFYRINEAGQFFEVRE